MTRGAPVDILVCQVFCGWDPDGAAALACVHLQGEQETRSDC